MNELKLASLPGKLSSSRNPDASRGQSPTWTRDQQTNYCLLKPLTSIMRHIRFDIDAFAAVR